MEKELKQNQDYWNEFYKNLEIELTIPSQFAAFIAIEYLGKIDAIIDMGCGNGRDSIFFSSLGFEVVGVDSSGEAIEYIKKKIPKKIFLTSDISDRKLAILLKNSLKSINSRLIYSRFFLHAISDNQELDFWNLANIFCQKKDIVALEFRTIKDKELEKVTTKHYRRFVDPVQLEKRAANAGFVCVYKVEGVGYAKYKTDDAYVARMIFEKDS